MEGFRYVDLFATKGLEYLLAIVMLLSFILFWRRMTASSEEPAEALAPAEPVGRSWFHLPDDVFYHQGHAWARPDEEGVVRVGMDDFAQKLVGPITSVRVPDVGAAVVQGEEAWSLRADSRSVPMLSPVDGEVVAVNPELAQTPEQINRDPYGAGWLMKVRVPKVSANLKNLLSGALSRKWMDEVENALAARMAGDYLGLVYQDGGLPVDGMARSIDPEEWDRIAASFFLVAEGGE
jgi:glycine cleavage system H lipoate-binding protein